MDTEHVVRTFVEYYEEHGHRRITGSTLLPEPGDPVLFTSAGLYGQAALPQLAAALLPFALGGLYLGNHLHARLPAERIRQAIWGVLVVGGISLVVRNL